MPIFGRAARSRRSNVWRAKHSNICGAARRARGANSSILRVSAIEGDAYKRMRKYSKVMRQKCPCWPIMSARVHRAACDRVRD